MSLEHTSLLSNSVDNMHLFGDHNHAGHHGNYTHVRNHIRVVVMGSAGVGKTTLIKQCLFHEYTSCYRQTVEDTYHYKGDNFDMEILDTSGSYNFPDMMKLAIREGDIFVLVFSVDDVSTLDRLSQFRKDIIEIKGANAPMIVVGNKADVENRAVPSSVADSVACIDWECSYHDVSATDSNAVTEVFNDVLKHFPSLYGEKIVYSKEKTNTKPCHTKNAQRSSKFRISSIMKLIHSSG